MVIMAQKEVTG